MVLYRRRDPCSKWVDFLDQLVAHRESSRWACSDCSTSPCVHSNVVFFNCFLFIQHFSLVSEVHHVSWNRCSSLNCFRYCVCPLLFVASDDYCLSADRLHVDCHVVLEAVAGVVVLAVVAELVAIIGLMSRSYRPLVWGSKKTLSTKNARTQTITNRNV